MDVESFSEGILAAVVVNEGERATVGAPIAFVAESDADVAEAKKKAAAFGGPAAAAAPAAAAPAAPPPPSAPAAAPAPPAVAAAPAAAPAPAPPSPAAAAPAPRADGRVVATPYAKQLAKDLKVDLARVSGTGPNGRITASDVERAAGKAPAAAAPQAAAAPAKAAASAPVAVASGSVAAPAIATTVSELRGTTKPFTSMQMAVSKNMVESLKVSLASDWGVAWMYKLISFLTPIITSTNTLTGSRVPCLIPDPDRQA